ncbi:MAG: hypothetical protein M0030_22060 [Actinomycetota bacterium]|nr:hypothetical protein [Actinomycetota bacterium]
MTTPNDDPPAGTPAPPAGARTRARPAGSALVTSQTAPYVTRPTRWTVFLRTFVPWQLWRFARINAKMFGIIFRDRARH